jgi:hypothetical protein
MRLSSAGIDRVLQILGEAETKRARESQLV